MPPRERATRAGFETYVTGIIGVSAPRVAGQRWSRSPDECASPFASQLTALIAYLTVVCRLPRLVARRFVAGALQIPISLGSTQKPWEGTSAAVAALYTDLEVVLRHEPVLNADKRGTVLGDTYASIRQRPLCPAI